MVRRGSCLTYTPTIQGDTIESSVLGQASNGQSNAIGWHASERYPTAAAAAPFDATFTLLLPFSRSAAAVCDTVDDGRDPFTSTADACEYAGYPEPDSGVGGGIAGSAGPEPTHITPTVVDVCQPEHACRNVEAEQ